MNIVIDQLLQQSVLLNGIALPGRSVADHLSAFAVPLVVWHDDVNIPVQIIGTGTLVRYKDRFLCIFCRHQLRLLTEEQIQRIGLLKPTSEPFQTSIRTSNGIVYFPTLNDHDAHDMAVLDFTHACLANADMVPHFFNFRDVPPVTDARDVIAFITTGYPYSGIIYDVAERQNIDFRKLTIISVLAQSEIQSGDETLLTLVPQTNITVDLDGISGGPTFVVLYMNGTFEVFLAGVNVRANSDFINIVRIGYALDLLDLSCERGPD